VANALTAAEGGQRLIRELSTGSDQFFMDAHQVAFTAGVQLQNLVAVGRGLFRAG
jgi:hypothetical protein